MWAAGRPTEETDNQIPSSTMWAAGRPTEDTDNQIPSSTKPAARGRTELGPEPGPNRVRTPAWVRRIDVRSAQPFGRPQLPWTDDLDRRHTDRPAAAAPAADG